MNPITKTIKESGEEFEESFPTQLNLITAFEREVEKEMELHTHNSIPSYINGLDEGCQICVKNKPFYNILTLLQETKKELKK